MKEYSRENLLYRLIQSIYMAMYCACFAYLAYYLMEKGYTPLQVGTISMVFCLIGTILQPILGSWTDRSHSGWKLPLYLMIAGTFLASAALIMFRGKALQGFCFGIMSTFIGTIMPLVNTMCFTCTPTGTGLDYGKARGIGSAWYAIASVVIGFMTGSVGEVIIPILVCVLAVAMFALISCMPYYRANPKEDNAKAGSSIGIIAFMKEYKTYPRIWFACFLMMVFHFMVNTYMINIVESVGKGSDMMGIAVALAAVAECPIIYLYSRISRHASLHTLFIIASATYVVRGILYLMADSIALIMVSQLLQFSSFALYANISVAYAKDYVDEKYMGFSQSLVVAALSAATVVGNFAGGAIIDAFGLNAMLAVGTAAVVLSTILVLPGIDDR